MADISFSVSELSELLFVDVETVRRWIRSGALSSTISSKKKGHKVSCKSFARFLLVNRKYLTLMTRQLAQRLIAFPDNGKDDEATVLTLAYCLAIYQAIIAVENEV